MSTETNQEITFQLKNGGDESVPPLTGTLTITPYSLSIKLTGCFSESEVGDNLLLEMHEGQPALHAWVNGVNKQKAEQITAITLQFDRDPDYAYGFIPAEAHTDDAVVRVDFNAARYFHEVSPSEIVEVLNCNGRNDYPTDAIAHFIAETRPDVMDLFNYLEIVNRSRSARGTVGFECSLDTDDLLTWLEAHRPDVRAQLIETEDGYLLAEDS